MQSQLSKYIEWMTYLPHTSWFYGLMAVLAFVFWKVVINSPVWVIGRVLALHYSPEILSKAMEISCDSASTHVVVSKQPGNLPAIRKIEFRFVNTLQFLDVDIRRAEIEVWVFNQALVSRERFIGEVVKSTRGIPLVFNIDLDELRLSRLKEFFPPAQPTSLDLQVKLGLQCATFFARFETKRDQNIRAQIY